ncbi:Uu.00g070040.m01.CDS01 [Anthostomella pinea]|uniref:Uu.00g070040.m01.CDS01 n=1 Tax=Anthostomella pinea TaxID=933095 RepID=A0AAI8VUM7_9PEZI|nr:Uu.00g070040.m01.CDS01 [Anthostomella pinea]
MSENEQGQSLAACDYSPIVLGPLKARLQKKPLYINIERSPIESGDEGPDMSLCGRLDGETLGHIGVQNVLATLDLSWNNGRDPLQVCSDCGRHHPGAATSAFTSPSTPTADKMYNMSATTFCKEPGFTPRSPLDRDPKHHIYVQVENNTPWTVFLAGADKKFSRVCFGCPQCTVVAGGNYVSELNGGLRTIIGYA